MTKKKSAATPKLTDAEKVTAYMQQLQHPLKAEINAVRDIILNANNKIAERIKWNAPSYYYQEDLVTFNPRAQQHVHLVFHHPAIVTIQSELLKGDYKDRRMAYFTTMAAVEANKPVLESIINQLLKVLDAETKKL